MTRQRNHHSRTLQIMPADGWWVIAARDDGGFNKIRVVAFALVDRWTDHLEEGEEPLEDTPVTRDVVPMLSENTYIDNANYILRDTDILMMLHQDERIDDAGIQVLADEHYENRIKEQRELLIDTRRLIDQIEREVRDNGYEGESHDIPELAHHFQRQRYLCSWFQQRGLPLPADA